MMNSVLLNSEIAELSMNMEES